MSTLVLGASGATGKLLVNQLLKMNKTVKVIIRSSAVIPDIWRNNNKITIIFANVSELSIHEMMEYLKDCDSVVSCLGHNITLKGIFGKPRKLVTNSIEIVCRAIIANAQENKTKLALMSSTAISNDYAKEKVTLGERLIKMLIYLLLPPHVDNVKAAKKMRMHIGDNKELIEWVAIRPDTLIDEAGVSEYELHSSPIRSSIFNPGKTSRINVADFISTLITNHAVWAQWQGKMPVIYNKE